MKIAILTPNKSAYSETFISNHIKYLPFEKIVIYGGRYPSLSENHELSALDKLWFKIKRFAQARLGKTKTSINEIRLRKILRKEEVDVVFSEYLFTGAEVTPLCKSLGIPIVSIALGYEISQYDMLKMYEQRYRGLFSYASYLMVVSNHMKKNMIALGCDEEKIVYSPAGPDNSFFDVNPTFKSKQIFALGRFVEKKAPHLTILAFAKVLKKHKDAKLVMGGDGNLLQVCKDLVIGLEITDAVIFKGRINQQEQKELLKESILFVQHSRIAVTGDSEGTPVAILEANAAGIPVVSTLHAGIPEVIKQGVTGLLSKENDIDAFAQNMIALLDDLEGAKQMGAAGKVFVKAHFSLENHIAILKTHLEKSNN